MILLLLSNNLNTSTKCRWNMGRLDSDTHRNTRSANSVDQTIHLVLARLDFWRAERARLIRRPGSSEHSGRDESSRQSVHRAQHFNTVAWSRRVCIQSSSLCHRVRDLKSSAQQQRPNQTIQAVDEKSTTTREFDCGK